VKVGLVVPGGVGADGVTRVIPCLLALVERLARMHDVHVFALRQAARPARYPLLGATVHVPGEPAARVRALAAILSEHRRGPFDAFHGIWALPGVIAGLAGRLTGRAVALHLTGGDLASIPRIRYGLRRTARGRAWLALALRLAASVTVPSQAMRRTAAGLGIATRRLTIGVDCARWPPAPPRPRAVGAAPRLVAVGGINAVKDPDTLIGAAATLRDAGIDFHLDVVGIDTLAGRVQRRVAELRLQRLVTFHGELPHTAVRPIVEAADVLVVASLHEADPVAALEAAIAGVPVVGTRVGHLDEWAPHAAVAVPPADPRALAAAITDLLADEPRRLRIAAAGQRRALEHDADAAAAAVDAIYRRLVPG